MKLLTAVFTAALCSAQVSTIKIAPRSAPVDAAQSLVFSSSQGPGIITAPATLGYALDSNSTLIRPILGTPRKHTLGEPLPLPLHITRIYLPPRELYALVERNGQPLQAFVLSGRDPFQHSSFSIPAAAPLPDLVAFSPRGERVILYSRATGRVQLFMGLPSEPTLLRELAIQSPQNPSQFALTDDGTLILAGFPDGAVAYSLNGAPWQPLALGYIPKAWSFVPNTHDLIIADPAQGAIALFPNVDRSSGAAQILSLSMEADLLAVTKDGEQLVSGSSSQGLLSVIDLKTRAVSALPAAPKLDSLTCLRDGRTFLLSASPLLSLISLGDTSASPAILHPTAISREELKATRALAQ